MNPATFNYLLERLEELQEKLDGNPFNAVANREYWDIMKQFLAIV